MTPATARRRRARARSCVMNPRPRAPSGGALNGASASKVVNAIPVHYDIDGRLLLHRERRKHVCADIVVQQRYL